MQEIVEVLKLYGPWGFTIFSSIVLWLDHVKRQEKYESLIERYHSLVQSLVMTLEAVKESVEDEHK